MEATGDVEYVQQLLREKIWIDAETLNLFKEQEIDMEAFLDLTEENLKDEFGMKVGPRKKMMKLIRSLKTPSNPPSGNSIEMEAESSDMTESPPMEPAEPSCSSTPTVNRSCFVPMSSGRKGTYTCSSEFDVELLLASSSDGNLILNSLRADGILSESSRKQLVQIVVADLVKKVGYYPTTEQKTALAEAIVKSFPTLAFRKDNLKGYEAFFDPESQDGYISFRLKTIRVQLTPSKKKNTPRSQGMKRRALDMTDDEPTIETPPSAEVLEKVTWLKNVNISQANVPKIFELHNETFQERRQWITSGCPTITDICDRYPRFRDVEFGELLIRDFQLLKPDAKDLRAVMNDRFAQAVRTLAVKRNIVSTDVDETLNTFLLLIRMLPESSCRHKGKKATGLLQKGLSGSHEHFLQIVDNGTDIQEWVAEKPVQLQQPFLLMVRGANFHVIADRISIDVGSNPTDAVHKLFSSFFAFNCKFPDNLVSFYSYLETSIYDIPCSLGKIRAGVAQLSATINQLLA